MVRAALFGQFDRGVTGGLSRQPPHVTTANTLSSVTTAMGVATTGEDVPPGIADLITFLMGIRYCLNGKWTLLRNSGPNPGSL